MTENAHDLMRRALYEVREVNRAADSAAESMAELLHGRLRHVSHHQLARLKRELRDFNMHTGEWKS